MIYFTADEHFDHSMILEYCKRPFDNVKYMEKTLIRNFNSELKESDITYHIGDFSLHSESNKYRVKTILEKLNGTHVLILGNHDQLKPFSYVDIGFQSVHTYLKVEEFNLAHDPATATVKQDEWWLCGHVHNLFQIVKNVVNVGVDVWNFYPISIDCIRILLKQKED